MVFFDLKLSNDNLIAVGQIADERLWARICKIDPSDGCKYWEVRDAGIYNEIFGSRNQLDGLLVLNENEVIALGETYDSKTGHSYGMIIKVSSEGFEDTICATSFENNVIITSSINVYPNPACSHINVDCNELSDFAGFELYNTNGELRYATELRPGQNNLCRLSRPDINSGVYFWKVYNLSNLEIISTGKLVIE